MNREKQNKWEEKMKGRGKEENILEYNIINIIKNIIKKTQCIALRQLKDIHIFLIILLNTSNCCSSQSDIM